MKSQARLYPHFGSLAILLLTVVSCAAPAATISPPSAPPSIAPLIQTPAPLSTVLPVPTLLSGTTIPLTPTANAPLTALIWNLQWSPDGRTLAAATRNGIILFDAATHSRTHLLSEGENIGSVAFSPDGTRLACVCGDGLIKLWDVTSGSQLKTVVGDRSFFTSVVFNPNGIQLAAGDHNGRIMLWDARADRLVFTLAGPLGDVQALSFSPDGRRLLSSTQSGTVKVWDSQTGQVIQAFPDSGGFFGVEFSPDGTRMATSTMGGDLINVWVVQSQRLLTTLSQLEVIRYAFTRDSQALICFCQTGFLIWDAATGSPRGGVLPVKPNYYCMAPSPDGKRLAVGTSDGNIELLNLVH